MAALREPPAADFSHIYTTGQREIDDKGVPETSEWAKKYSCGPQRKGEEIVDTKAGYVYDSTRLNRLRPGLGTSAGARQGSGLSSTRTARTAGSSPMSFASIRDTPKGLSRKSPKS